MARSYIPATVPMEFVSDFKTSSPESEDDGVTQSATKWAPISHRARVDRPSGLKPDRLFGIS